MEHSREQDYILVNNSSGSMEFAYGSTVVSFANATSKNRTPQNHHRDREITMDSIGLYRKRRANSSWSSTSSSTESGCAGDVFDGPPVLLIDPLLDHNATRSEEGGTAGDEILADNTSEENRWSFLYFFSKSPGPPQIVFLCILFALAHGSTVGVVPAIMTDRYAVLRYDFDPDDSCGNYDSSAKPQACLKGSNDAQSSAVSAAFFSSIFVFLTSSLVGSVTDQCGRRNVLNLGQFISLLGPLCLVIIQMHQSVHPNFYYIAHTMGGIISWTSIALSAISDVMPKKWRAPSFGILLSGFSFGYTLSSMLTLYFTHFGVSIMALLLLITAYLYSLFFLPETLPNKNMVQHTRIESSGAGAGTGQHAGQGDLSNFQKFGCALILPITKLAILKRNHLFRLLSALSFFSGMSIAADQTLLIYYLEEQLDFNDHDIAVMNGLLGFLGMFIQGLLLKPLSVLIGDQFIVVLSFICGTVANILYAFATSKYLMFVAICISTFQGMAFPTISAIKSGSVSKFEQGRLQGALFALQSLASAVGPCSLRLLYERSVESHYPGSFFLLAAVLFFIAAILGMSLQICTDDQEETRSYAETASGRESASDQEV